MIDENGNNESEDLSLWATIVIAMIIGFMFEFGIARIAGGAEVKSVLELKAERLKVEKSMAEIDERAKKEMEALAATPAAKDHNAKVKAIVEAAVKPLNDEYGKTAAKQEFDAKWKKMQTEYGKAEARLKEIDKQYWEAVRRETEQEKARSGK